MDAFRDKPPGPARAAGRPRSESARSAVLEATRRLLATSRIRDLAVEAIAAQAGVGKATIYRWWPNKNAVVIDAFVETMRRTAPRSGDGSQRAALAAQLRSLVDEYRGATGRFVAELVGEAQADPALHAAFRARFFDARRADMRAVVERGIRAGEFAPGIDVEAILDMLYGAVYFRLLMGHQALDAGFAASLDASAQRLLQPHQEPA